MCSSLVQRISKLKMCECVLLSLLSALMASSTIQSGVKPCVLDSRPSREAIFSLTELSVSWESKTPSAVASCVHFFTHQLRLHHINTTLRHCKSCLQLLIIFISLIQNSTPIKRHHRPCRSRAELFHYEFPEIKVLHKVRDYSHMFLVMTHSSSPCSSAPTGS